MKPLKEYALHPYQLSLSAWNVVKKIFGFLFANKRPIKTVNRWAAGVEFSKIVLFDLGVGLCIGVIAGLAVLAAAFAVELLPIPLVACLVLGVCLLPLITEQTNGHSLLPLSLFISLPMIAFAAGPFVFSVAMMGVSLVADLIALPFVGLAELLKSVWEFIVDELGFSFSDNGSKPDTPKPNTTAMDSLYAKNRLAPEGRERKNNNVEDDTDFSPTHADSPQHVGDGDAPSAPSADMFNAVEVKP